MQLHLHSFDDNDKKIILSLLEKKAKSYSDVDNLAKEYYNIKAYNECIKIIKEHISKFNIDETFTAYKNLIKVLNRLNRPDEAIDYFNKFNDDSVNDEIKMEYALSLYFLGDKEKSRKIQEDIFNKTNDENLKTRISYNLSIFELINSNDENYIENFKNMIECGLENGVYLTNKKSLILDWDGKYTNSEVLIFTFGGIGDELIFARYIKLLQENNQKYTWVSNYESIVDLFNKNGIKAVHLDELNLSEYDSCVQCNSYDLPYLCNSVPKPLSLETDPTYIEKWKNLLPKGKKIAIKWSGNQEYEQNLHRDLDIESFVKNIPDEYSIINLQIDKKDYRDDMFNAGKYILNLDDTIAIMSLCDHVVSSCTSVAHLCISSGIDINVFIPISSYFVWEGSWYDDNDKLRKFRKSHFSNWDAEIAKFVKLLK